MTRKRKSRLWNNPVSLLVTRSIHASFHHTCPTHTGLSLATSSRQITSNKSICRVTIKPWIEVTSTCSLHYIWQPLLCHNGNKAPQNGANSTPLLHRARTLRAAQPSQLAAPQAWGTAGNTPGKRPAQAARGTAPPLAWKAVGSSGTPGVPSLPPAGPSAPGTARAPRCRTGRASERWALHTHQTLLPPRNQQDEWQRHSQ